MRYKDLPTIDEAYMYGLRTLLSSQYADRRNGMCLTSPGLSLQYKMYKDKNTFPILIARKMFYKGVLGELAAFVRGPKCVDDFKKWGCNYWDQFAGEDGSLNVDYGNAWIDWNGKNQLEELLFELENNPGSRRLLITGWNPTNVPTLTLPCCHFAYQFVAIDHTLSLVWYQRSADYMVGVPSDMLLANVLLIGVAHYVGMEPYSVTLHLGDAHIYEEHVPEARRLLANLYFINRAHGRTMDTLYPSYELHNMDITKFTPDMISLSNYKPSEEVYKFRCIL